MPPRHTQLDTLHKKLTSLEYKLVHQSLAIKRLQKQIQAIIKRMSA
jgi:uncharacterized coiled-coil protein SlyX